MSNQIRESLLRKPFNDFRNYPYGFSRSGDFSIRESDALTQYGCLITALLDGSYQPQNQEDEALLAAATGQREAVSLVEKTWLKYLSRINRPKVASMYGKGKFADESLGQGSEDSEDDLIAED